MITDAALGSITVYTLTAAMGPNSTTPFNSNLLTPFSTKIKCTLATCDIALSLYDYRPSVAVNLLFLLLFAITGFMHLTQLLFWPKSRFFAGAIAVGCFIEVLGYLLRIVSNKNPFALAPYFTQFIALTIAPAFFSASIYGCLGDVIKSLGPQFSRLRPEVYSRVFVGSDLISLIFQGVGGLTTLGQLLNGGSGQAGIDIVLVGLVAQILSLIAFIYLGVEFGMRLKKHNESEGKTIFGPGSGQLQIFFVFFCLSVFCLFIRCIYRFFELAGGLEGELLHDQILFIFLEGMLVAISVFALNLGHPGMLPPQKLQNYEDEKATTVVDFNPVISWPQPTSDVKVASDVKFVSEVKVDWQNDTNPYNNSTIRPSRSYSQIGEEATLVREAV